MNPRITLAGILLFVSSCAWQSGVQRLSEDTWLTSANASPMRGASAGARRMALSSANKHCAKFGKTIDVVDMKTQYAFPTNGVVTVTFRCK